MSPLERFSDFNLAYQGMLYPMDLDHMGHANVRYYSRAFNEAAYYTFTTAGVTPGYMRANARGMAAVTENFLYRREILAGDLIAVLDSAGVVTWQCGIGPHLFDPDGFAAAIEAQLATRSAV